MLHELFLGLLGFPGDVLVWADGTMRVKDGFDLLNSGERDQVNQLAPLGWYCMKLQAFVDEHSLQWSSSSSKTQQDSPSPSSERAGRHMYRAALSQGVADLLEEYTADVVYLEQLVLKDGPVPLSQVLLHLQKYLVCMPPIYHLLTSVQKKNTHGCQILDGLARFQSGNPAVMDTIRHILVRVRNVFLKQCVGWMLYGSLDDNAHEFFIQKRVAPSALSGKTNGSGSGGGMRGGNSSGNSEGAGGEALNCFFGHMTSSGAEANVLQRFNSLLQSSSGPSSSSNNYSNDSSSSSSADKDTFDWAASYVLKVENLPESHMTPSLASKVLFAGKAVMLLQRVSGQERLPEGDRDVYRYLSGEGSSGFKSGFGKDGQHFSFAAGAGAGATGFIESTDADGEYVPESRRGKQPLDAANAPDDTRARLLKEHSMRCGYTPEQIDSFTRGFHLVLHKENMAVEVLEGLIEDIHAAISSKLWATLRDTFGFHSVLNIVRNTFLMGKGELYQLLLDGITAQTYLPPRDTRQSNLCLNWKVVRSASAIVGLPDDALSRVLRLRVNSYHLEVQAAAAYLQANANRNKSYLDASSKENNYTGNNSGGSGNIDNLTIAELSCLGDEDVCGVLFGGNATVRAVRDDSSSNSSSAKNTTSESDIVSSCVFCMCPMTAVTPEETAETIFHDQILNRAACVSASAPPLSSRMDASLQKQQQQAAKEYSVGALWLSEPKYIAKGFSLSSSFFCDWARAVNCLYASHPWLGAASAAGGTAGASNGALDDDTMSMSDSSVISAVTSATAQTEHTTQSNRDEYMKSPAARRSLLLGCLSCCIHADRRGTGVSAQGSDIFGVGIDNSIIAGASFHMRLHRGKPQLFLRVFVATRSSPSAGGRFSRRTGRGVNAANSDANKNSGYSRRRSLVGTVTDGDDASAAAYSGNMKVLAEALIGIDDNSSAAGGAGGIASEFSRNVSASSLLALEVEYTRNVTSTASAGTGTSTGTSTGTGAGTVLPGSVTGGPSSMRSSRAASIAGAGGGAGSVYYTMRVRVVQISQRPSKSGAGAGPGADAAQWDVTAALEIPSHIKLQGGEATLGLTSSGLVLPSTNDATPLTSFGTYVRSLQFDAKNSLSAYPVASPFTISRYPDTFVRLEKEMSQLRAWLGIQLRVSFPPVFHVIFDADALSAYHRLFTLLMRIRLIAHSLERLWKTRSRLAQDRNFCQLRHSMHFFISNFLYYLQVDVVDSEYAKLLEEVKAAEDFQQILRIHRNFLATVLRVSLADNATVQDSIERVLQSCLRFIAVCRLLHQQELSQNNPDMDARDYLGDEDLQRFRQDASPNKGGWQGAKSPSPLFHPAGAGAGVGACTGAGTGAESSTPVKSLQAAPAAPAAPPPRVAVPKEEVESIRKEFFVQISFLFQVMRKVENRGFMFRLDYNEYLSGMAAATSTRR